MAKPKVVIVGGGLGGLNAAKKLKKCDVDILIIDKTNHHLFQPLLYQVASAALSPGEIAIPIREVVSRQKNVTVMMGDVVKVDKISQTLTLANEEKISYDYLVLAVGARHSYFGHDEWERYAFGLKTVKDALTIREKILLSFEKAERFTTTNEEFNKYLNFVIIGGGPTGVEMAGAIAEIAHKTMFKNFRRIKPEKSKIYLIEATSRILSMYPEKLAFKAKKYLNRMGVIVIEGKRVTKINEEGVQVEEEFYPCTNIIWAAGNQASSLLKTLNSPLDRQGRAIVNHWLSIPDHPEIFVIGDAAQFTSKNGFPLPGVGSVAIQQGHYVAKVIEKRVKKIIPSPPFKYWDKGSMATIGRGKAIAVIGKFHLSGILAWFIWCFVHITYLIGFRNRLTVMIEWILFYITGQRGARLIYSPLEEHPKDLP
jgi:NADH:ubiquinone reductase (H+-translocating)